MTDHSKRASVGGRPSPATPKLNQNATSSAGSSVASTENALQKALGAKASIKYRPIPNTVHTATGFIDSVSSDLHQLILRERPNGGELRLIAIDRVLEFNILDAPKPDTMPLPVVPLTQREIQQRVDNEIAKERSAREHMGQGVDKGTQDLYDALRRMFPGCKWSGKNFIINESALVEPPYASDNVRPVEGVKGAEKNVAYVKKVLESERKKLADKAATAAAQTPGPAGQRKGG